MLVLFDIDGTLMTTSGVGRDCMAEAGRLAFDMDFTVDGVPFAGRLDPLIIADLLRANGREPTPQDATAMREAYGATLCRRIAEPGVAQALPGVHDLVGALAAAEGVTLGLLTGNFPETGSLKVTSIGFELDQFAIPVWGDASPHDPPHRDHLPPVGMQRFTESTGASIEPERVLIIGDTPHDIRCAKVNGCRVLAVGTGRTPTEELAQSEPDLALDSLADTARVVSWITEG